MLQRNEATMLVLALVVLDRCDTFQHLRNFYSTSAQPFEVLLTLKCFIYLTYIDINSS